MMGYLRDFIQWSTRWWQLIREEIGVHVPWSLRWEAWRHGFLSRAAVLYDWRTHGWPAYLSDKVRYVDTPSINGPWGRLAQHKFLFSHMLETLQPGLTPALFGLVVRGRFLPYPVPAVIASAPISLLNLLAARGSLMLKPEDGGGGVGVVRLEWLNPGVRWNGQQVADADLDRRIARAQDGLIMECLTPAAYARAIEGTCTHTLRIVTMWDSETGGPFVAAAAHRFATRASAPTDNWGRGGLSAAVALPTGELGAAVRFDPKAGRKELHTHHPETGSAIAGVMIPGWGALLALVLELSRRLPWLPYIGWDVVMTDQGPRVLEVNSYTGVTLLQVHAPLLTDPRVRRFYQEHCSSHV